MSGDGLYDVYKNDCAQPLSLEQRRTGRFGRVEISMCMLVC